MKNYNLGICSVSFRQCSPEEVVKLVADAGLNCIEWGSDVHAPFDDEERIMEIAKLQEKYNIKCSSYGTYFHLLSDSLDLLPKYIKAAKNLGTSVLRLWCGEKGSSKFTEDEKEYLVAECKKAAQIAKENGVVLCMEYHPGSFTDTAESALWLIEKVDSPHFKMYWQGNVKGDEELALNGAKLLSPHTVNIHVAHWVDSKLLPLENGISAWTKYLKEFTDGKSLLLEFIHDGKPESLPGEAKSLKAIVDGI